MDAHGRLQQAEKDRRAANRRAAEKRKATIAARNARPQIIDDVGRFVGTGEIDRGAVDHFIEALTPVADKVPADEWDEWVEGCRIKEAAFRNMRLRLEALRSGEALPKCDHCGETVAGRSDARFCSTRCRVAAHRAGADT